MVSKAGLAWLQPPHLRKRFAQPSMNTLELGQSVPTAPHLLCARATWSAAAKDCVVPRCISSCMQTIPCNCGAWSLDAGMDTVCVLVCVWGGGEGGGGHGEAQEARRARRVALQGLRPSPRL